jgi:hypothetical protein
MTHGEIVSSDILPNFMTERYEAVLMEHFRLSAN